MKIEAGKYYEISDGDIGLAKQTPSSARPWLIAGWLFNNNGSNSTDRHVVREVRIVPVLPFELRAGQKYDTVKPDGSPGPVVTLEGSGLWPGAGVLCPWDVRNADGLYHSFPGQEPYANASGEIYGDDLLARITAEHVEPKLTAIERLEKLRDGRSLERDELEAIIADLKAESKA